MSLSSHQSRISPLMAEIDIRSAHSGEPQAGSSRQEAQQPSEKPRNAGRMFARMFIFLLFVAALGTAGFYYRQYQHASERITFLSSPQGQAEAGKEEVKKLLEAVAKLIVIPQNEDPLVATVQDAKALADQSPFYKDARNGDKLIVFRDRAILYRAEENRLVNASPFNAAEESTANQNGSQTENTELESGADQEKDASSNVSGANATGSQDSDKAKTP